MKSIEATLSQCDSNWNMVDVTGSSDMLCSYVCVLRLQCCNGNVQLLATSNDKDTFLGLHMVTKLWICEKDVKSTVTNIMSVLCETVDHHMEPQVDFCETLNEFSLDDMTSTDEDVLIEEGSKDLGSFEEPTHRQEEKPEIKQEQLDSYINVKPTCESELSATYTGNDADSEAQVDIKTDELMKFVEDSYTEESLDIVEPQETTCDVPSIAALSTAPYVCVLCKESFSRHQFIMSHRHVKHADVPVTERIFQCGICVKNFENPCNLRQHLSIHAPVKMYRCREHCDKSFTTKYQLKNHILSYSGVVSYQCAVCGKAWATKGGLNGHMVMHNQVRSHQCNECGKTYSRMSDLKQHAFTHGDRQFRCIVCGKSFMRPSDVRKHSQIHNEKRARPYKCRVCGKAFTKKSHMLAHMHRHSRMNTPSVGHPAVGDKRGLTRSVKSEPGVT